MCSLNLDGKGKVRELKWKIKKEKFCQKTTWIRQISSHFTFLFCSGFAAA